MDVRENANIPRRDDAAARSCASASANSRSNSVQLLLDLLDAFVDRFAFHILGDAPIAAGVGKRQLGLAILLELLHGQAVEQREQKRSWSRLSLTDEASANCSSS